MTDQYEEWRDFYAKHVNSWMSLEELRAECGKLLTADRPIPEALLVHAMHALEEREQRDEALLRQALEAADAAPQQPAATSETVNVIGMPEFDGLLDHIYEHGTAAEGVIEKANAFARAVIARYAPQQPAAVDEAMVFRLAVWMAKHDGCEDPHRLIYEGSPPVPWGEVWNRYEYDARAALTAALATQHQEPTT